MDLTHAHIPMEDGTFEVLYNREQADKNMMDPNSLDYTSEDEFDEVPYTIKYVLELLHTHLGFIFPKVFPFLLVIISHYPVSYILGKNLHLENIIFQLTL